LIELRIELLLGRVVHDVDGAPAGRIEEVVTGDSTAEGCFVQEVHLGPAAIAERLAVAAARLPFFGWLARHIEGRRVPWEALDCSDLDHLRLRRRAAELEILR
jgi:hypothetical protein